MKENEMESWITVAVILAVMGVLGGAVLIARRRAVQKWLARPLPPGTLVPVEEGSLYATVLGRGKPTVIVCNATGSLSLEWFAFQEGIAKVATVCTYDRGGIGWSAVGKVPRTGAQIVRELEALLLALQLEPPYILIGHSIGGLYAQHFARLHPDWLAGLVLVDPITLENHRFDSLDEGTYQASTAMRIAQLRRLRSFAQRGLMRPMQRKLMASHSWESLRQLSPAVQQALFEHYCRAKDYDTSIDELEHLSESIMQIRQAGLLPDIPVILVHHDPQTYQQDLMAYGLSRQATEVLETLWSEMHHELLTSVKQGQWLQAKKSSHSDIHLREPELIVQAVFGILSGNRLDTH